MKRSSAQKAKKPNIAVRLLALLLTAVLVLGAVLLVVWHDRLNVDSLRRWLAYRSLETSDTGEAAPFTHGGGDKLSIAYLESGILQASTSGSHYYSFSGEQYAENVAAMSNPVLSASLRAGVVYDAGGRSLSLFRRGELSPLSLELDENDQLLSARVNGAGWLAVTTQQSGFKGVVTVYNENGAKVIQIRLSSAFAVDAALSPDCKTVAVVTLDQKDGSFFSSLLLYPVDKEEPSAQVDLGNTVVLDLDYEADRIWVLGEDRITLVPADGSQPLTYSFGRSYLKGCSFGGDGFALLLLGRYRSGSAFEVLTIGPDAAPVARLEPDGQVLSFSCAGNYCSLLTGRHLQIYTQDLRPYASLDSTQSAVRTALAPNGSALLANDQKAWLFIPQ